MLQEVGEVLSELLLDGKAEISQYFCLDPSLYFDRFDGGER